MSAFCSFRWLAPSKLPQANPSFPLAVAFLAMLYPSYPPAGTLPSEGAQGSSLSGVSINLHRE